MVLKFRMKKIYIYPLFASMLLFMACDEKIVFVNCSECKAEEPVTAGILLKLEPENTNYTNVKVYRGTIEDSILVDSFTTESTDYTYKAEVNTRYTFTAEYLSFTGRTTIAVNSAFPRVKYEKTQCQNPCYYVYDNSVNLRIKYH
jgi:hypothetical protein